MKRAIGFSLLGWVLTFVMVLYLMLVVVPGARAGKPPKTEEPEGKLIFEMKSRKLRIFVYEDDTVQCYVSVVDVSMIGLQTAISCVKKDAPTPKDAVPFEVPLR